MEQNYKWKNVGCGFEGVEDIIRLQGWSQSRRVIILRKKIKNKNIGVLKQEKLSNQKNQLTFHFAEIDKKRIRP